MSIYSYSQIKTKTTIRKRYDVPAGGLSGLERSQKVGAREIVASADIASEFRLLDLADMLNVEPDEVSDYLETLINEPFSAEDVIARKGRPPQRITIKSPIDGRITRIENGVAIIEGETKAVEVLSSVPGTVVEIDIRSHVIIETIGTQIQAAWGRGKSLWGTLRTLDNIPSIETDASRIDLELGGAIIVLGSPITEPLLKAAQTYDVRGIVGSSISASLIPKLDAYDGLSLIATQGFGEIPMSTPLLQILSNNNGREAALSIDDTANWRENRPEIIIPLSSQDAAEADTPQTSYQRGDRVRVLQAPFLGEVATIRHIADEAQQVDSGLWVLGATVEMPTGEMPFVPFANLERLE